MQAELDAAAEIGIPYYVFHPGPDTGAGEETGIENMGERLSDIHVPDDVTVLQESTACKGTTVGKRREDPDETVEISPYQYGEVEICLDTCRLFAAGYDSTDEAAMDDLVEEIDSTVGTEHAEYLHRNDSKHPLDSEKDEHEHIGEGEIGDGAFRSSSITMRSARNRWSSKRRKTRKATGGITRRFESCGTVSNLPTPLGRFRHLPTVGD